MKAQEYREVSRDWTAFHQTIDASFVKDSLKFRVSASVKVDTTSTTSWGGLWARVDNKKGGYGFFDNMGDRPVIINEWQNYVIEGVVDQESKNINFGGLCLGNGRFYFDNFKMEVETENGVFKNVPIKNQSFEETILKNNIPGWSEGVSGNKKIHVKEYTISSTEQSTDGRQALVLEASSINSDSLNTIGPIEGFSPQIGTLVSMLNNLAYRVEQRVQVMSMKETDHLYDSIANSIGALIMHLAAAEVYYQVYTFENRGFNEEEAKKWGAALDLGEEARKRYRGRDISYYLNEFREVRKKTIEELRKRDDAWLAEKKGPSNNHFMWFHVMEHQSSHLGQILMQTKRYPEEKEMLEYKLEDY
ncbi:MAG: DUF664 domain-containing protein [Bacteroidota bacterium]